jgi:hypothetical protein
MIDDVVLPSGAQKVLMVRLQRADEVEPTQATLDVAAFGRHLFEGPPRATTDEPEAADAGGLSASRVDADATGVYGRLDVRADRLSLPRFPSTASRVTVVGPIPLVASPDDIVLQGLAVEGGAQIDAGLPLLPDLSDNLRLFVTAEQLSGRASVSEWFAALTEPVAVDFTGTDPVTGDPGTVLPAGVSGESRIETRAKDRSVRIGAAWDWGADGSASGRRVGSSVMLGYGELAQDIRRSDRFDSGEASIDDVALDQERATIDLSLFGQRPFGHGRFSLYGEMGLRWQHASADMHSSYSYRDPATITVERDTRDRRSDTSLGAYAEIELGYQVSKSTVLSMSAKVSGGNGMPTLLAPDTSVGNEIRLGQSDDELRESFGIGLIHAF